MRKQKKTEKLQKQEKEYTQNRKYTLLQTNLECDYTKVWIPGAGDSLTAII